MSNLLLSRGLLALGQFLKTKERDLAPFPSYGIFNN